MLNGGHAIARYSRCLGFVVFTAASMAGPSRVLAEKEAGKAAQRHQTFADVVREHFTEWDTNHDGRLDTHEIDEAIRRRGVHGEVAAALATIKTRERQALVAKVQDFAQTESQLTAADETPSGTLDTAREDAKPFHAEGEFTRNLKRLANVNHRLFASEKPDFDAMHQGGIGDCFFFSVVGNLAAHQPQRIRKMIVAEASGGYSVHFGDGEKVEVAHPSDVEIIINNSTYSVEDGIWLTVLEKAVGHRLQARSKSHSTDEEETDAISHGGSSRVIISMLTGHQTDLVSLRDPKHEPDRLAELRRVLPEALASHRLAAVSMAKEPPAGHTKIPRLGYGHVYALFGFDPATDRVELWNPWGNNFTPKQAPGVEHGFETKHGVFHVPLKTLYAQFSGVVIEGNKKLDSSKPGRTKRRN
ncbi:MAG TPA: C2 family cysteine protease [Pirellulales bacterium]|jgi:hypothetical protein|nr:C2 family cysteine protease [Pirellulales bacterium]